MSRSRDPNVAAIDGGEQCRKCRAQMQRYQHGPDWKPQPGRNYYRFWDVCKPCSRVVHYPDAKVMTEAVP